MNESVAKVKNWDLQSNGSSVQDPVDDSSWEEIMDGGEFRSLHTESLDKKSTTSA